MYIYLAHCGQCILYRELCILLCVERATYVRLYTYGGQRIIVGCVSIVVVECGACNLRTYVHTYIHVYSISHTFYTEL